MPTEKWNVRLGTVVGDPQERRGPEIDRAQGMLSSMLEGRRASVVLVSIRETPELAVVEVYGFKPWDLGAITVDVGFGP